MNSDNNTKKKAEGIASDSLQMSDLFFMCIDKWYILLLSVIACIALAFLYLAIVPPQYSSSACLIIKQDRRSGNSGLESSVANFSSMGTFFTQQTNVFNEIIAFKSPTLMSMVVDNLDLRANYTVGYLLYRKTLYGSSLPVKVIPVDFPRNRGFELTIVSNGADGVSLCDMSTYIKGEKVEFQDMLPVAFHDTVNTPVGRLTVVPSFSYMSDLENQGRFKNIRMTYSPKGAVVKRYVAALNASLTTKEATAISISAVDKSAERARDVVAGVIDAYNEIWVNDRNQIAKSTSKFINERLVLLEKELGDVDSNISSFKAENLIVDPTAAGDMFVTQANKMQNDIAGLENRLSMARYIRSYLQSSASNNQLLPANSGIENSGIEKQISEFNELQLNRNRLLENSSPESPVVKQLDMSLAATRESILASIDNFIVTLKAQISSLRAIDSRNRSKISASPKQAEYLTDIQRQQKVKESLYLYLLQKREENELSQAFTAYNTRLLAAPQISSTPSSPQRLRIFIIAILIGLAIPSGVIYLLETLNTKVRGRRDLSDLSLPFLGEVPVIGRRRFRKSMTLANTLMVRPQSRDMINESFRVVRSNLEFMVGKEGCPVIQTTSFNVASGKTFCSLNLASACSMKDQRVCLVDLDIRKASLSMLLGSPKIGVSDYLAGKLDDMDSIIVKESLNKNLDIIPCGSIPPNPTELLYSPRLGEMLSYLRKNYDYVFLDCPPVEIVADSYIINAYTDRTLFVVRAGLLDKHMLPELEKFYKESKYKGLMILLNATSINNVGSRRYNYNYSYGYGYAYGSKSKLNSIYGNDRRKKSHKKA